jgi:hypothetical protein
VKTNLTIASLTTAAAAGIHFAVAPEHFAEWWGFGVFFVLCGVAQLLWAAWPAYRWIGIGGNALLIAIWAGTRVSGYEPVGVLDALTVLLEAVAVNRTLRAGECHPSRQLQGEIA